MSIIRVKKDAKYFAASNEPFNDERLSWETRGLMGYLLSKPNDWTVRFEDLVKKGPAGAYKVRKMLKELRKYGYMNRIRIQVDGGTFEWETEIYESPDLNPNPSEEIITTSRFSTRGLPTRGGSTRGLPTGGKPRDIVSTEEPSTDLQSTDEEMTEEEAPPPAQTPFAELSAAFCNESGIPELTGGPKSWIEATKRMVKAGVSPADVINAYHALIEKGRYTIVGIQSVENAAYSEMSRRNGRKKITDEEQRKKYVSGELSEYIEH